RGGLASGVESNPKRNCPYQYSLGEKFTVIAASNRLIASVYPGGLRLDPNRDEPFTVNLWGNLRRLDLASADPQHIGEADRDSAFAQVLINRRLVLEKERFVRSVGHGHDVDVAKLRSSLSPVAVSQNFVSPDLPTSLDLPPWRNRPVKKCVKSSDPNA